MAEVSKTDLLRLIRYLDDAADLYGRQPGQRNKSRQYYLKQYSRKLRDKINKYHNDKTSVRK